MSVKVMSAVFERYPNGGGEMVLALAIADHAWDDGTHVFPSVRTLAAKSRQSERTVQYQLRKMESDGWLLLVGESSGGRGNTRQYRINPDWIANRETTCNTQEHSATTGNNPDAEKGAEIAPIDKGCNSEQKRVQSTALKGATAIAPEPSLTINEPSSIIAEQVPAKKSAKNTTSRISDEFALSAGDKEFAICRGVSLSEFDAFVNYHKAKGSRMACWNAAWRTWVLNAVKFAAKASFGGKYDPYASGAVGIAGGQK